MNETDSRYTFTYDDAGRVTGISSLGSNMPQVTLTNTYDGAGNRTNVRDNLASAGSMTFTYDEAHRMTNIDSSVGGSSSVQVALGYDNADRLTSLARKACKLCGDQTLTTFSYDNTDRVTLITHTYSPSGESPTTLASYTYNYNAASELTSESHQDGTFTYSYDNTSQLTAVDGPNAGSGVCQNNACDETFAYDVNGNRTSSTGYGLNQTYTTGTANRLTADGIYSYTYDDNGNTLTKTKISDGQKYEFAWDFRNRLTQVLLKNSGGTILQQTDYTYDAFNRRIIKVHDPDGPGSQTATTTKTVYDGASFAANPYADFDGSNALTMRYVYGPAVDLLLARRDSGGTIAWHLGDHLGTIRDVLSTGGSNLDHVSYSAFGKVADESNSTNGDRFKYTAREFESETNLQFSRARYFDLGTGRWMSTDPLGFYAGDSNLYRYVFNRATLATDPTGQELILGFIPHSAIHIHTVKGKEYKPSDAADFKKTLDIILQRGDKISRMIIKGHGSSTGVILGPGKNPKNALEVEDDGTITIGGQDFTKKIRHALDIDCTISIRACHGGAFADKLEPALSHEVDVIGYRGYTLNIPGTPWVIPFIPTMPPGPTPNYPRPR